MLMSEMPVPTRSKLLMVTCPSCQLKVRKEEKPKEDKV